MVVHGEHGRLVTRAGEHRFVFGRPMAVARTADGCRAFRLGNEGKRRPADIQVPPTPGARGVRTWLADPFRESATPRHSGTVARD